MRIAIFTETWVPVVDGLTTSLATFRRELLARGHTVHIVTSGPKHAQTADETRYWGIEINASPGMRISVVPGGPSARGVLRDLDIDVVHCASPGPIGLRGLVAAKRVGLPVVTGFPTFLPDLVPYVLPSVVDGLGRLAVWEACGVFFRASDLILVPGASVEHEIRKALGRNHLPPIEVQPNGVDVSRFSPERASRAIRQRLAPDGKRVAVSVGRLAREKGLSFLLDAFARARREDPDLALAIGGEGPERARLERQARSLDLSDSVRFLGFVSDEDLPGVYASADAFVSASTFETQGMTALEALACGTPAAVAHARGYADYVERGRGGFPFPPRDLDAAARAIIEATKADADVRKAARSHALRYDVGSATDLLEKRYARLVEEGPRASST